MQEITIQQDLEKRQNNSGSIYRSYKERIIVRIEDRQNVPGPGSYNLPQNWPRRKPHFPISPLQEKVVNLQHENNGTAPSIPNEDGRYGYSLKNKELIQNLLDQEDFKGISDTRTSAEQKNKGISFSKSKVKRKVFIQNGVTSLVDYPRQEVRLSYKCKKSCMFQGASGRMSFQTNSEKALKKLFCGQSDVQTKHPKEQQTSPGPGSYNLSIAYEASQRTERQHSLPFISGASRQASIAINGSVVGPDSYHVSLIGQNKGVVSSFKSSSKRDATLGIDTCVPSVGSYHIKRTFDDCIKSSSNTRVRNQGRVWYKSGENSPGPAFYYHDSQSIAWKYLYVYQPQPNFRSNVERQIFEKRIYEKTPGPGAYLFEKKTAEQDCYPVELLPKPTPFMTNQLRFKPLVKEVASETVPNQNQMKHKIINKVTTISKPFLSGTKRFIDVVTEVPAPGSYYDMKKNYGEWSKRSYNLLFNDTSPQTQK